MPYLPTDPWESFPQEQEFNIYYPSFVERGGFMTIVDPVEQVRLKLPRWEKSPCIHYLEGTLVYRRHFTSQRLYLVSEDPEAYFKEQREKAERYASRRLEDVFF
jgi:hypothetical protein